jgi:ABC-type dipeptide/oligopeptide/nickel transport system ATPase component
LIPSPPGKIEKGKIYFHAPNGNQAEIDNIEAKIRKLSSNVSGQNNEDELKSLQGELNEVHAIKALKEEREKALELQGDDGAKEIQEIDDKLSKLLSRYDLLARSLSYMQKIRGKHVSMIFQEPMSALNPVFTSGDQIAEVLLQHERKELAQAVMKIITQELTAIKQFQRAMF